MLGRKKWASMRWRIVLIYFLLVFIAMAIVSVFITNQLETYQLDSVRSNLTKTVKDGALMGDLQSCLPFSDENNKAKVQEVISNWSTNFGEEMSVIDSNWYVIASSNPRFVDRYYSEIFEHDLVSGALVNGSEGEMDGLDSEQIPVKNMAFPIEAEDGEIVGAVYIMSDISSIYDFLSQSKSIFVRAIVLALLVTVVLGFFIASSITVPINDVTKIAEKMSEGDFSRAAVVKSDDEIGRLAEMFNLLREKLDFTLTQISNEKSKLETILTYMADGLIAIDLSGHIIHANPAARRMLSIDEEDIQHRYYDDIIEKYDKNLLYEELKRNIPKGGQTIFDYGRAIYAARYAWFKNEEGKNIGIIMVMQDITERQKLENMQTDFVANVSHELKTPLTTIKSYTETLLDGVVDDEETVRSFLTIIDTEADRMNRLVKDLLQLSRVDYMEENWYMKESNLIFLLKSVITKVEMTASMKSQHLNSFFDPEQIIKVVIDKDRIEQVILNILSNAIKYTQEGGRIDIDVIRKNDQVAIVVTDNGIGIAEEEIPRIFERFYRVDKARSRSMGGTGLGLSIAKQIVEGHGGTIEVESRLGKGTKATILLPLAPIRGQRNID